MPKQFYTEKDVEDMARRGELSITLSDDVVLTELAYEKAKSLGVRLESGLPDLPPAAPVRPYVARCHGVHVVPPAAAAAHAAPPSEGPAEERTPPDLEQRIRAAVGARLGPQVDAGLLDVIIKRVLAGTGVK